MIDTKTVLIAQIFISGMMAFLMTDSLASCTSGRPANGCMNGPAHSSLHGPLPSACPCSSADYRSRWPA